MTTLKIKQESQETNKINSNNFMVNFSTKEGEQKKGPLELIWSLIQKYEVDIFEVSLKMITTDFFDYIQNNKVALEQKSWFSKISAQLIFYKSKSLLPNINNTVSDDGTLDKLPEELIDKLLEYKKLQVAAEYLNNTRNTSQTEVMRKSNWQLYEKDINFFQLDLTSFLKNFQQYLLKSEVAQNKIFHIQTEEIEVEQLQDWLHKKLTSQKELLFFDLISKTSLIWTISLFLAILEMSKQKIIGVSQIQNKNIIIKLK